MSKHRCHGDKPHTSVSTEKCCTEDGDVIYSHNVPMADLVAHVISPIVLQALEAVASIDPHSPFSLCEYGCADGGVTLGIIRDCVKHIKSRYGPQKEVVIVYNDKPVNDFRTVFGNSYAPLTQSFPGVYLTASGASFYTQCLPSNSLDLGFTALALPWLSTVPCRLDSAIHHLCATNPAQAQLFSDQAAADWQCFLLSRAKELKTAGYLVAVSPVLGDHYNNNPGRLSDIYRSLRECWLELATDGTITKDEADNLVIEQYFRTETEYCAPFRPGTAVSEAGLRLVSFTTHLIWCPHYARWMAQPDKGPRAARTHAKQFVNNIRAWSYSYLLTALSNGRPLADRQHIVGGAYQKLEDHVTMAPERYYEDYDLAIMVIRKE